MGWWGDGEGRVRGDEGDWSLAEGISVKTNSVERFRQLVIEIKHQPNNLTTLDAIANGLGVRSEQRIEFYSRYAAFLELADEVLVAVGQIPSSNNEEHYLKFVKKIRDVYYNMNLFAPWENYRNQLDDISLHVLRICADQANSLGLQNKEIETNELKSILDDLQDLVITIADSELPDKLKVELVCLLEEIREKVLSYKVTGPEGLGVAVMRAEGFILANQHEIVEHLKDEKKSATLKSFWKFVVNLNALLSAGKNIKEIAPPVVKFLQDFFN
jgi:hypothetical protein